MELRINLSSLAPPAGRVRVEPRPAGASSDVERYFTGWLEFLRVVDDLLTDGRGDEAS